MKRIWGLLLLVILLGCPALAGALDSVYLKDGGVIQGQVTGYRKDTVTLAAGGKTRNLDRNLVARIVLDSRDQDKGDTALARQYQVPVTQVQWARLQGIPDQDLGQLFNLAAQAQVAPVVVVKMRLAKMSWQDIRAYFKLPSGAQAAAVAPKAKPGVPVTHNLDWWAYAWEQPNFNVYWNGNWGRVVHAPKAEIWRRTEQMDNSLAYLGVWSPAGYLGWPGVWCPPAYMTWPGVWSPAGHWGWPRVLP